MARFTARFPSLLLAVLLLSPRFCGGLGFAQPDTAGAMPARASEVEFFPIISYDSDAGFGYGGKVFAVGMFAEDESFDLTLFNSSKGERWYRFVFSIPDFERRQGMVYPAALDIVIDYDKWIAANFFGIGNTSRYDDRRQYTKEPLELSIACSRGFTRTIVGQIGIRFKAVRNFSIETGNLLLALPSPINTGRASALSVFATLRYDTRNSYINASEGTVIQWEGEWAPQGSMTDVGFARIAGWFQFYHRIIGPVVLAGRAGLSGVAGNDVPVQFLLPVGGGSTVRGSPQDRLLGRLAAITNVEFRFPIVWRLCGIVGGDAGQVWERASLMSFDRWLINGVAGLRLVMDTFVVRLDFGAGKESSGVYVNFGHVF